MAAFRGHKDTVELLVDRGADLEAKNWVSVATACCYATGQPGRHGRSQGAVMAMMRRGRGASVAGRRARRRWP